jgi:hypothetical protein
MKLATFTSMVSAVMLGAMVLGPISPAFAQQIEIIEQGYQPPQDVVVDPSQAPPVTFYEGPGCPVPDWDMRNVLSGYYGVDALARPVNSSGIPVDTNGQCLTAAPVGEIFTAPPAQIYTDYYAVRYHTAFYFNPGYVHLYAGPGVIVNRGYGIPAGRTVVIQHNSTVVMRPSQTTTVRPGAAAPVTVSPGATGVVRPGATSAPAVVSPGASGVVRPGATVANPPAAVVPGANNVARPGATTAPAAQTAPSAVMPSRPDAGTGSAFQRPAVQSPATQPPTAVMPSRPAAQAPSAFTRPTAPPPSPAVVNRPAQTAPMSRSPGRCMPGRPC